MSKILLFTDLHAGCTIYDMAGREGVNSYASALFEVYRLAEYAHRESIDTILFLGDLIDFRFGRESEFEHIAKDHLDTTAGEILNYFQNIFSDMNIHYALGNQDCVRQHYGDNTDFYKSITNKSFTIGNTHHIILNFHFDTENRKLILPPGSLAWYEQELERCSGTIYTYCHYPISNDLDNISYYHVGKKERVFIPECNELLALCKKYNVSRRISGHVHVGREKKIDNTVHTSISSFAEAERDNFIPLSYSILDVEHNTLKEQRFNKIVFGENTIAKSEDEKWINKSDEEKGKTFEKFLPQIEAFIKHNKKLTQEGIIIPGDFPLDYRHKIKEMEKMKTGLGYQQIVKEITRDNYKYLEVAINMYTSESIYWEDRKQVLYETLDYLRHCKQNNKNPGTLLVTTLIANIEEYRRFIDGIVKINKEDVDQSGPIWDERINGRLFKGNIPKNHDSQNRHSIIHGNVNPKYYAEEYNVIRLLLIIDDMFTTYEKNEKE